MLCVLICVAGGLIVAKVLRDSYVIFLVSLLVGLLCWLAESVVGTSVRLGILEQRLDKLVDEMLILKDDYRRRREE